MPIYEYRCEDCAKTTEVLIMGSNDKKTIVCKCCGSKKLRKLISKPAAVIMGHSHSKGSSCCGRTERCDSPPCSDGGVCERNR